MTSIHDFVGGDYLKAADLSGAEPTAQIREFTIEQVKGDEGKESKCVCHLHGYKKRLIIGCKANAIALLEMFKTDQIEEWNQAVAGTPTFVQLFTEQTNLGPGLRIRPAAPPTDAPATGSSSEGGEVDASMVRAVVAEMMKTMGKRDE